MSLSPTVRHTVASVLAFVALGSLVVGVGHDWYVVSVALALLLFSTVLIHLRPLGPQLLSRAVWWANLALGVVLCTSSSPREQNSGVVLALTTGAALLVVGRKQLGEAGSTAGYVPASLRSVLMLLMVFALADAQTFLLFGSAGLLESGTHLDRAVVLVLIGILYVVGFVGLYRLRVWGALLNAIVSVGVLGLIVGTDYIGKTELSTFLAILAIAHIIVAAPVALTSLAKRSLPSLPVRARGIFATGIVVALMVVSVMLWTRHFNGSW